MSTSPSSHDGNASRRDVLKTGLAAAALVG